VPTDGYAQADSLNRHAAQNKSCALDQVREQNQRGQCKEESGGHDEQSGELHGRSFPGYDGTAIRTQAYPVQ
jgi:hypothetical protein